MFLAIVIVVTLLKKATSQAICPAGTTYDPSITGRFPCKPCPRGSVSSEGSTVCNQCPPGTFSSIDTCFDCPAGQVSPNAGSYICTNCPADRVAPVPGMAECVSCGIGMRAASPTECKMCLPGTATVYNNTCSECPPGFFASWDRSLCLPCAAGFYSPTAGSPSCRVCPPGYFSPIEGSYECTPCAKGYYAARNGSSICSVCPQFFTTVGTGCSECVSVAKASDSSTPSLTWEIIGIASLIVLMGVGWFGSSYFKSVNVLG